MNAYSNLNHNPKQVASKIFYSKLPYLLQPYQEIVVNLKPKPLKPKL